MACNHSWVHTFSMPMESDPPQFEYQCKSCHETVWKMARAPSALCHHVWVVISNPAAPTFRIKKCTKCHGEAVTY